MKLYYIKSEYLDFISKYEPKVEQKAKRPYIGFIENINGHDYFLPLTSKNKKTNITVFKLQEQIKGERVFLSSIHLNNAIPVSKDDVNLIDFEKISNRQMKLFKKILKEVKKEKDKIFEKFIKVQNYTNKGNKQFFKNICVDYALLEKCCDMYQIIKDNEDIYNKLINNQIDFIKDNPTKLIDKANNEIIDLNNLDYDNDYEEDDYNM